LKLKRLENTFRENTSSFEAMRLSIVQLVVTCLLGSSGLGEARSPLLVISFDGLRASKLLEFIAKNPKSHFSQFREVASRAPFMRPSFPSATFPNHITLVTGLYPESHGVVGNTVYDPVYDEKLRLAGVQDVKWWNASEPIYFTARKQGLRTGSSFWVGNDAYPRTPDIFLTYKPNNFYSLYDRADEVVSWFGPKINLDFANMYFDEPDIAGHAYGPDSPEYEKKVSK
jgi:ectonucleotide pyrophosphatase/phosphodiesterase family protein 5